jgi:hypothetical protein
MRDFSDVEIEALERLNLNGSPTASHPNGSLFASPPPSTANGTKPVPTAMSTDGVQAKNGTVDIGKLEKVAAEGNGSA